MLNEGDYITKKKIYSKHLEKGKFYKHSDVNGGHPALIYKKDDSKDSYYAVCFTTSKGKKRVKLKHDINPNTNKDVYVLNNPIKSRRQNFSNWPFKGYRVHKDDKNTINKIKRKK